MMSHRKVNIVFVSLYTEMGGGEYGLLYLLQHLDRDQFYPMLICNGRGPLTERVEAIGVETIILPFEVVMLKHVIRPNVFWKNIKASVAMKKVVRARNVDVIQCSDVLSFLLLLPAILGSSIPVIYSVTFMYEWSRAIVFNMLALFIVDHIIVLSQLIQADIRKKTIGLRRRIRLIYWGVDLEKFIPRSKEQARQIRSALGLPVDKKIVGFIGRYELWKGHLTLLDAAKRILQSTDDVVFLVVGGAMTEHIIPKVARYRKMVEEKIHHLGVSDRLTVWGHRDDVPEIMSCLNVFVCPSDVEPFGLVVVEALASGVPVVVSSRVGALEVARGRTDVFVAEPMNADSFAQKITEALLYAEKNTVSGVSVSAFPTWNTCARQYESLYTSVTRKAA